MKPALFICSLTLVGCLSTLSPLCAAEQTRFSLEEKLRRPTRLPAPVLRLLNQDRRVRETARTEPGKRAPAAWFSAATVRLDRDALPDLLVKAEDARLWGANQGPFWLFRRTRTGYQPVFTAYGLSLELRPHRTRGWKDVRTQAASARQVFTRTFRFNGRKYVPR
jgi:hypothetical protein